MKQILFVFLFIISANTFSQNIKLEGTVKDTLGNPLEMANIMAVNNDTKAMDGYSITNDKGQYQLNLKANSSYTLKVTFIGYQSLDKIISTQGENTKYNVVLKEGVALDQLELVYEMPVTISGDTIIYNSDSFTNGTEKKLEDVLKKLPGVEVNSDGEITVEGKKVQKIMVEGKDFFDGDTKIATKNIPADALDKIQVLRNYNEVSNLRGLENNEDNVAINIKLKEGKKNFWFGDMTAGVGVGDTSNRYLVNPKLFYYSPKYSINVIGNLNNIGELPLTARDYFKFTGGFKNMMQKGGSSFNVSSNDLGILGLRNDQAKNIESKFGAANFSYNPSKALTISGFGIFLGNKTQVQTNSVNDIPNNSGTANTQEIREDKSNQKSDLGIFKLSSSYVPSAKMHLDYDVFVKFSNQKEKQAIQSTEVGSIFANKNQQPFSINQNLNYYYTLNDKNVFAFETQFLHQTEDPFYNANLQMLPFILSGYNNAQVRDDISQTRFVKTNKVDAKFDYYYMLTPKSNLNFTLGNTYSHQNFNSHIFQVLDNSNQNDLNSPENNNEVQYGFTDVFLGVHYKFLVGKFIFNPGISAHNYSTNDDQLSLVKKRNFNRFLPDVYAQYQIKKSENLTYTYSMTNNFTDIVKLSEGFVFSNYNSLFSGNRNLENALNQVHNLRYFKYNMFNFENIFANLTYTKQVDAIKNRALLTGVNQVATAVNIASNFADESFSGMANYGRSFLRYYKASAGFNLSWSKFNNIRVFSPVDQRVQTTENFSQNYNVRFSTNFKKIPNLGLKYSYAINDNSSSVIYTNNPAVDVEWFFLDAFSFISEYSYFKNTNKQNTINTEYDFLSASINYQKKNAKWEWKLSGTNLLETKALNTNSFNQLGGTSSFSSYIVQPRYVILTAKYNL